MKGPETVDLKPKKEKEKRDRKQAERQTDAAEFMPPSAPRGVLSLCVRARVCLRHVQRPLLPCGAVLCVQCPVVGAACPSTPMLPMPTQCTTKHRRCQSQRPLCVDRIPAWHHRERARPVMWTRNGTLAAGSGAVIEVTQWCLARLGRLSGA